MFVPQSNPVLSGLSALNAAEQGQGVPGTSAASVEPVIGFAEVLGLTFSTLEQGLTTRSGNLPEGTPLAQHGDLMLSQDAPDQSGSTENDPAAVVAKQNSVFVAGTSAQPLATELQQPEAQLAATTLPSEITPSSPGEPAALQPPVSVGNALQEPKQQELKQQHPNVIQPVMSAKPGIVDISPTQLNTSARPAEAAAIEPGMSLPATKSGVVSEPVIGSSQANAKADRVSGHDNKPVANNGGQRALPGDESTQQQDRSFNKQAPELQASLKENVPQKLFGRIGSAQSQQSTVSTPAVFSPEKLEQLNTVAAKPVAQPSDTRPAQKSKTAQPTVLATQQAVPAAEPALVGQHLGAVNSPGTNSIAANTATTPGPQAATPQSIPVSDIAVHMAQNRNSGTNEFTIRLTPESMGTITVKMNLSKDAGISGVLQVEKPETLVLLQKDVAQLEKALKSQGLNAKDGSFTLVLKNPGNVAKAAEGLTQLAAGATGNSADVQANNSSQNTAGQNSFGQNASGQNASNHAINSQNANTGQQPNNSSGFEKSLGNANLTGGEQNFQQSSREHAEDRQSQMQSSLQQGQQDHHDAESGAEQQDHHDNEVPEVILSAYAARKMHINMSARLDLSI